MRDAERQAMVRDQLVARGIHDAVVLEAMRAVPRHLFVPEPDQDRAYADRPLPIGRGATISQPYVVALTLELARIRPGLRVLDVGTGSGYQAAIIAQIGAQVRGVEIDEQHAADSATRLAAAGFDVLVRHGDGHAGWPEHAPFDAIVLGVAPREVPEALRQQLADGGRLVLPVGERHRQTLTTVTRVGDRFETRRHIPVVFMPMSRSYETPDEG